MGAPERFEADQAIDWGVSVKRVAILAAFLLTIATLLTHEAYVLRPADPMWRHLAPFRWWLLPHVAGGMLAFLLTPFQLSATLRRHAPKVHRWGGRVYAGAALTSSALSVYIVVRFEIQSNWWVMGTMGALWFAATAFGWVAALNRNFVQHQLWMGRSIGLTFTFVLTRIIPDVLLPGLDHDQMTALYWAFIIASLIIPDLVVNGRAIVPGRRRRSPTAARQA
jgi:hypothetical protein